MSAFSPASRCPCRLLSQLFEQLSLAGEVVTLCFLLVEARGVPSLNAAGRGSLSYLIQVATLYGEAMLTAQGCPLVLRAWLQCCPEEFWELPARFA